MADGLARLHFLASRTPEGANGVTGRHPLADDVPPDRPGVEARGGGTFLSNHDLHWIANYIWGIADDVLRDLYVRGKYRDVILPMTVLRRLDAVLEGTKQAVLDMKAVLDQGAGRTSVSQSLRLTGHFFRLHLRLWLRDRSQNRRIL